MSRAKLQAQETLFLQLYKAELVVRLEAERREAKARLRLMDAMASSLDDQLLYVAEFKKQWLQHRWQLEAERQKLCETELARRTRVEEEWGAGLTTLVRRHDPSAAAELMSGFMTPGRQPDATAVGGTSSGRRILRSALEKLLDAPSPYPSSASRSPADSTQAAAPRAGSPPSPAAARAAPLGSRVSHTTGAGASTKTATVPPKGFTVTYATRGPASVRAASVPAIASAAPRGPAPTARLPTQEPSALLFLSPNDPAHHRGVGEAQPALKRGRSVPPAQVDSPNTSRSLLAEVEEATKPSPSSAVVPSRAAVGEGVGESAGRGLTEAEVRARVAAALAAYERQRDEEETAVLQAIDKELEEKEETNRQLAKDKAEVVKVAKSLQAQLTRVMEQFEEVQRGGTDAVAEQQALREALSRAEVELCHARDAARACGGDVAAQTEAVERLTKELGETKHTLAAREAEVTALRARVSEGEAALAAAQHAHAAEYADIRSKMLSLGTCMTSTEAALGDKDRTIAELQRRVEEGERGRAGALAAAAAERQALERRVAELQSAVQTQTDEVRRRIGKVSALEGERRALRERVQALREAALAAGHHQSTLQAALGTTLRRVRRHFHRLLSSTDAAAAAASAQGELQSPSTPHALDRTRTFDSDEAGASEREPDTSAADRDDDDDEDADANARGEHAGEAEPANRPALSRARRDGGVGAVSPRGRAVAAAGRTPAAAPHRRALFGSGGRARTLSMPALRSHTAEVRADTAAEVDRATAAAEQSLAALQRSCVGCQRLVGEVDGVVARHTRQLEQRVRSMERSLGTQSAALRASTSLAGRLEAACRQLQSKLTAAHDAVAVAQQECEARGEDLQTLAAERDAAEAARARLDAEVEVLRAARDTATAAQTALEDEVVRLHAQLEAAAAAVHGAEASTVKGQAALEAAQRVAAEVPTLQERLRMAESAVAREQAAAAALGERVRRLEGERAAATAEVTEVRGQLAEVRSQLECVRAQQSANRGRDAREAQQAAAERARLQASLDTARAEAAEARAVLTRERAAHVEVIAQLEAQGSRHAEAAQTQRAQLRELARETAVRRDGEHATLATILDTVEAALGAAGGGGESKTQPATVEADGEEQEGEGEGEGGCEPPSSPTSLSPSPVASSPGGGRGSARTRVALLSTTLRGGQALLDGRAGVSAVTGRRRGTALMRREAVQAVQRVVLELARLQQQQQQQQLRVQREDSFTRAEWLARSAAQWGGGQARTPDKVTGVPTARATGGTCGRSPSPSVRLFSGELAMGGVAVGEEETFFDDDTPFRVSLPSDPRGRAVGVAGGRGRTASLSSTVARGWPLPQGPSPVVSLFPSPFLSSRVGPAVVRGIGAPPGKASPASSSRSPGVRSASASGGPPRGRGSLGGLSHTSSCERSSGDVDGSGSPARPPPLRGA